MNVYDAKTYREFVRASLDGGERGARRGAVKKLAHHLKCHSTYVSQVTSGRADFSLDQGARFCSYHKLTADQTEFFLDLLSRDRAATREAKQHYQARVDRRLQELSDMKKRWRITETLTAEQELKYYGTWVPQAVHLLCQLPGLHTADSVARALRLPLEVARQTLADLESLGFVEADLQGYRSIRDTVHLGTDSRMYARNHVNWRLKAIQDMAAGGALPGRHYSSVISMSAETAKEIEALILQHIEKTRDAVLPSPPEQLYVYNLDFYKLGSDPIGSR